MLAFDCGVSGYEGAVYAVLGISSRGGIFLQFAILNPEVSLELIQTCRLNIGEGA